MKKITLGTLDYGLAFGVDRALRDLAGKGRLSAVGALVATDLWPREFRPLQETAQKAGPRMMLGVTLAFSGDRVSPVSGQVREICGNRLFSRADLNRRAILRLLPKDLLLAEAEAQLARYSAFMKKPPDFVAVREGLLVRSAIARIVFKAIGRAQFDRPPLIISPVGSGSRARLSRLARSHGLSLLPSANPLPEMADREELHRLLHNHFDHMADGSFVVSIPGLADDRLRRDEPRGKIAVRECQYDVLASQRFFHTLEKKDVFLS